MVGGGVLLQEDNGYNGFYSLMAKKWHFKKCLNHYCSSKYCSCEIFKDQRGYFAAGRKMSVLEHTLSSVSLRLLLYCRGGWSTRKTPSFYYLMLLEVSVQTWFFFFSFEIHQGYLWNYSSDRRLFQIMCHHMYFIFQELWLSPPLWCQENSSISISHRMRWDCLLFLPSTTILLLLLRE